MEQNFGNVVDRPTNNAQQTTTSKNYPEQGSIILIFVDKEITGLSKDEDEFPTGSPFQIAQVRDYTSEEEMKKFVLEFNEIINKYKALGKTGGEYKIFIGKEIKGVVTQIAIDF